MCISGDRLVTVSPYSGLRSDGSSAGPIYDGFVFIVLGIVVLAIALMVLAGRSGESASARSIDAISTHGLHLDGDGDPQVAPWSSVFEITVLTRRELRRTWFGFEIRTEGHGMLLLDGTRGPGEDFLAESHRFAGFNHVELAEALQQRGSRVVCYTR